jgi:hypothetical protein
MKPRKPNKLARKGEQRAGAKQAPRIVPGAAKLHAVLKSFDELRDRLHNGNNPAPQHDED